MIKFTLGGLAICVAALDERSDVNPLNNCRHVARRAGGGGVFECEPEAAEQVLQYIEQCPAYSAPGRGSHSEGFGGDYSEVAAVRRASDSIRKALGKPLRGYRRQRRKLST